MPESTVFPFPTGFRFEFVEGSIGVGVLISPRRLRVRVTVKVGLELDLFCSKILNAFHLSRRLLLISSRL